MRTKSVIPRHFTRCTKTTTRLCRATYVGRKQADLEYDVSKAYLLVVDGILWFLHMVLVAIAVEEAKCRLDQERPNALDVTISDLAMEETPSLQDSHDSEDDVYQTLLPLDQPQPITEPASQDHDWILPTTRKPIAYVEWSSLWAID